MPLAIIDPTELSIRKHTYIALEILTSFVFQLNLVWRCVHTPLFVTAAVTPGVFATITLCVALIASPSLTTDIPMM